MGWWIELGSYTDALASLQKICKERYSLTDDLPVHEKGGDDLLANLLESKSLLAPTSQEATMELIPQAFAQAQQTAFVADAIEPVQ